MLKTALLATALMVTPALAQHKLELPLQNPVGFCAYDFSVAYNIVTIPGNPPHQEVQWVSRSDTFGPYPTLAKARDVALSLVDIMTYGYHDPKYVGEFPTYASGLLAAGDALNFNKPYYDQFNMWVSPC
jgi:hypothetical protein